MKTLELLLEDCTTCSSLGFGSLTLVHTQFIFQLLFQVFLAVWLKYEVRDFSLHIFENFCFHFLDSYSIRFSISLMSKYLSVVWTKPYCRAPAYLIGCWLGYQLHVESGSSRRMRKVGCRYSLTYLLTHLLGLIDRRQCFFFQWWFSGFRWSFPILTSKFQLSFHNFISVFRTVIYFSVTVEVIEKVVRLLASI